MVLMFLILLFLGLIKGVDPSPSFRGIVFVAIVWDLAFLYINEKFSIREHWRLSMIALFVTICFLTTWIFLLVW